jgi:hypothetical protein
MANMDVFFITYDEPLKDVFWGKLQERYPHFQRIDGVKGFSRAHQECAKRSTTNRFFTIDGDSLLNEKFATQQIEDPLLNSDYVLSWSSKNSINGLAYGNGGVKNWPRELMLKVKTHEDSDSEVAAVDFCFTVDYFQMPDVLSTSHINATPLQAFRAGFREGMKLGLDRGIKLNAPLNELGPLLHKQVHASNIERLKIWCSVGADVENGLWGIYGARLGLHELYLNNASLDNIRDYDWFETYWQQVLTKFPSTTDTSSLVQKINSLGQELNHHLHMDLVLLAPQDSKFFKSVYFNRPRQGLMFV